MVAMRAAFVAAFLLQPPGTAQPQTTAAPQVATTVDTGSINGARFYIEIPKQWNKGLVLYPHGYTLASGVPPDQASPRMKGFANVFLTGHSMGGHITMATIERYPEAYQGALCGPLGAAIELQRRGSRNKVKGRRKKEEGREK